MRWPLRQVFELLRKGLPALGTALVTPLTLTVPQDARGDMRRADRDLRRVGMAAGGGVAPGKNMASDARAATERRPAGSRKRLLDRLPEWCAHASHAYLRRNRQL